MFCPKCGNQLPDGAVFCGACGSQLAQNPQQAPRQPGAHRAAPQAAHAAVQPSAQQPYQQQMPAQMQQQQMPAQMQQQQPYQQQAQHPAYVPASAAGSFMQNSRYFNARKGLKNLFIATMLSLLIVIISAGVAAISGGVVAINGVSIGTEGLYALGGFAIVVVVADLVMAVVSFILQLVGSFQASRDEISFRITFIAILAAVALQVLNYVMLMNGVNFRYMSLIVSIVQLLSVMCIFWGIRALAIKLGRSDVASSTMVLLIIAAIAYVFTIAFPYVGMYSSSAGMLGALGIVYIVCALLPTIMLLVALSKGKKMLA